MSTFLPLAGCDIPDVEYYETAGPPLHVTGVIVTQPPGETPGPIAEDGSSVVLRGTSFAVQFDRYLDPRTAIRQAYCLRSDAAKVEGFEECIGGVSTAPRYDPVTRTMTIFLDEVLAQDTVFTLTLLSPRNGADVGLKAFDGAFLQETIELTFRTVNSMTAELEEPAVTTDTCQTISNLLSVCEQCHLDPEPGERIDPPAGFQVSPKGLLAAVGRTAHETSVGADADESRDRPDRFGAAMPVIDDRQNPGNSYLLYKALAHLPGRADELADGETDRLRSFITGNPMPPSNAPVDGVVYRPLEERFLSQISLWIQSGTPCDLDE